MGANVLASMADPQRGVSMPGRWCLAAGAATWLGVVSPVWIVIGCSVVLLTVRNDALSEHGTHTGQYLGIRRAGRVQVDDGFTTA